MSVIALNLLCHTSGQQVHVLYSVCFVRCDKCSSQCSDGVQDPDVVSHLFARLCGHFVLQDQGNFIDVAGYILGEGEVCT